jgi:hypothetical protein
MKIPRYWARAVHEEQDSRGRRTATFPAFGWSFDSQAAAEADARARARRIFERVTGGTPPDAYDYAETPPREEILQSFPAAGQPAALITRNRYGTLVLNAAEVFFADIDFPPPRPAGFLDAVLTLFQPARRERRRKDAEDATLLRVKRWADENRGRRYRLYRTLAGLRLVLTDRLYSPKGTDTANLMSELEVDPLYRKLTLKQECFRARLTPKPWRCGCEKPPAAFPWPEEADRQRFQQWVEKYNQCAAGYRACELIGEQGHPADLPALREVLRVHDQHACGSAALPLA